MPKPSADYSIEEALLDSIIPWQRTYLLGDTGSFGVRYRWRWGANASQRMSPFGATKIQVLPPMDGRKTWTIRELVRDNTWVSKGFHKFPRLVRYLQAQFPERK